MYVQYIRAAVDTLHLLFILLSLPHHFSFLSYFLSLSSPSPILFLPVQSIVLFHPYLIPLNSLLFSYSHMYLFSATICAMIPCLKHMSCLQMPTNHSTSSTFLYVPYLLLSHPILSCLLISCLILSFHILSFLVFSYLIPPYYFFPMQRYSILRSPHSIFLASRIIESIKRSKEGIKHGK